MTIGILRETKAIVDKRVALAPSQAAELKKCYPQHKIIVQASNTRVFSDQAYTHYGIEVKENLDGCDVLIGVKEVNAQTLKSGKTYLFFSHTAKEQPQNRRLLAEAAKKGITLIDFEFLLKDGIRVAAFGYWAGIVGAYNAILGYGILTGRYTLKRAYECRGLTELKQELTKVNFLPPLQIVITGEGRVAKGAVEILEACGINRISHEAFLKNKAKKNVFCQIGSQHYVYHKQGEPYVFDDFVNHPENYLSCFFPFATRASLFIACHFWDYRSPAFLTREQIQRNESKLKLIADISCDVGGPIASTLRTSTIESPFYGYDIQKGTETKPFLPDHLTVMSEDNLPGEMPRDSSFDFGKKVTALVIPELFKKEKSEMIENATVLRKGKLTQRFAFLQEYLQGGSGR